MNASTIKIMDWTKGFSIKSRRLSFGSQSINLKILAYYLQLEDQFIESIEYVELDPRNYSAFSNRFAMLIQAIGAELDTLFKLLCDFDLSARKNISDYAEQILQHNADIIDLKVKLRQFGFEIQPFSGWDSHQAAQSLAWWHAFTDIKHDRSSHIQDATQYNALNILGALFLLEMLCLKKISEVTHEPDVYDIRSKLFTLENWTAFPETTDDSFRLLGDMLDSDSLESSLRFNG